jgi:ubiquinol-cytochrome c reductase iron-sulfur subunit
MSRLAKWLVALATLLGLRRGVTLGDEDVVGERERIVAPAEPDRRAETVVVVLLLCCALAGVAFLLIYAMAGLTSITRFGGLSLALAFAFLSAAMIVLGKRLLASEELEEDYPAPEHPDDQEAVAQIVSESGDGLTRKRLLLAAGGAAGAALGAAAVAPALSLGPWLNTDSLYDTPWRAGRRLVDDDGRPLRAADIERDTFYTAFPEDAAQDEIGSPLVVVRLAVADLRLPPERARWAPQGILAYSKICTHAGCAIALYRTPLYEPTSPAASSSRLRVSPSPLSETICATASWSSGCSGAG